MVKTMRLTQEEEVIMTLQREGFEELTEQDIQKEPYKSIYRLPDCFQAPLTMEDRQQTLIALK
jgi:hypothetical protein